MSASITTKVGILGRSAGLRPGSIIRSGALNARPEAGAPVVDTLRCDREALRSSRLLEPGAHQFGQVFDRNGAVIKHGFVITAQFEPVAQFALHPLA